MPIRFGAKRKFRRLSFKELVIVIVAILLIAGLFVVHLQSSNYSISKIAKTSADIVIGLRIEEIDKAEANSLKLESWQKEYIQRFNVPLATISLDYVYVSPKFISTNQICFSRLSVFTHEANSTEQSLINEDICNVSGLNFFVNQSTHIATFLYNKHSKDYIDPYFYPFDSRTLSFALSLDARLLDSSNKELKTVANPSVNVAIVSHKGKDVWSLENSDQTNDLKLVLRRPYMYPALSALMLPVIFIAMLSLLFLTDDTDDNDDEGAESGYWEVAVGILGIWSIQEVLLPSFIEGPTIVGDIILALYIFLSFIILFIFSRSIIKIVQIKTPRPKPTVKQRKTKKK